MLIPFKNIVHGQGFGGPASPEITPMFRACMKASAQKNKQYRTVTRGFSEYRETAKAFGTAKHWLGLGNRIPD